MRCPDQESPLQPKADFSALGDLQTFFGRLLKLHNLFLDDPYCRRPGGLVKLIFAAREGDAAQFNESAFIGYFHVTFFPLARSHRVLRVARGRHEGIIGIPRLQSWMGKPHGSRSITRCDPSSTWISSTSAAPAASRARLSTSGLSLTKARCSNRGSISA